MTDNNNTAAINGSRAAMSAFNTKLHDVMQAFVDRQNGIMSQVLQRIDILEQGQKLDRKVIAGLETSDVATRSQAMQGVDNFEELQAKVRRIDENLFARSEELKERVDRMERNFANEMRDVIRDHGTVREELQQLAAEEARDVLNDSDIEADSISGLADFVEEAVRNMDVSDVIDPGDIDPSRLNMKEFAWYLLDEPLVRNRFQDIDEGHSTDIERLKEVQDNIVRALGDFSFNILPINLIPKDERDNKVKEVADNAE